MKVHKFIVIVGMLKFGTEIEASTEKEAIKIINKLYPKQEGYKYILL